MVATPLPRTHVRQEATRTMVESIFLLAPDKNGSLKKLLGETTATAPTARAELGDVQISLWRVTGAG